MAQPKTELKKSVQILIDKVDSKLGTRCMYINRDETASFSMMMMMMRRL